MKMNLQFFEMGFVGYFDGNGWVLIVL